MKHLVCILLLFTGTSQAQTIISGTVTGADGLPVHNANVFIQGTYDGTNTDSAGNFSFGSYATDSRTLMIRHLEYAEWQQAITLPADSLNITVRLRPAERSTEAVEIAAGAFSASDKKKNVTLSRLDMLTTASANGDVYGALQTLPGTQTVGESGQLFVRGGAAYETRTFIDGMLVAQPYGSRLPDMPARGRFSPELFSGTLFSTGGYSAEYGQALSSALILETRDLAEENITGISLMSIGASLSHTQRWERVSAGISAGYTNLKPYLSLMPQNAAWQATPQGADLMADLRVKTGDFSMLKVMGTGSWNRAGMSRNNLDQPGRTESFDLQNLYGSSQMTWHGLVTNKWLIDAGLGISRNAEPLTLELADLLSLQTVYQGRITARRSLNSHLYLKTGISSWRTVDEQSFTPAGENSLEWGYEDQLSATFAEADWQPLKQLAIRAGLRAEHSTLLDKANLAPRLAFAYSLGDYGQVNVAAGRFFQSPEDPYLRLSQPMAFEQADHFLINYQWQAEKRTLRVEGYWKTYDRLATADQEMILPGTTVGNAGEGYARGLDLFWRDRETFDKLDYWVSYSFLDTRRQYARFDESVVPTFASAHNLSVVGKYYVPEITSQIGFTYTYSSPRPYHDPNLAGWNQGRTPAYHDLSLNISYLTQIADQFTVVYVSLTNVLGNEQIFGYRFSETPDANGHFAAEAIVPPAPRFAFIGVFVSIGGNRF